MRGCSLVNINRKKRIRPSSDGIISVVAIIVHAPNVFDANRRRRRRRENGPRRRMVVAAAATDLPPILLLSFVFILMKRPRRSRLGGRGGRTVRARPLVLVAERCAPLCPRRLRCVLSPTTSLSLSRSLSPKHCFLPPSGPPPSPRSAAATVNRWTVSPLHRRDSVAECN